MPELAGIPLQVFDAIDSTSAEAKRRAADGQAGPTWFLARHQTGGYGRRGDRWESGGGDLMATRLFPLAPADPPASQLSFVAAVAMVDALAALAPGVSARLKWPNDVMVDDAKICGLLAELVATPTGGAAVALGVGLNIVSAPTIAGRPTTRLLDHRPPPAPTSAEALAQFERAFAVSLASWRKDGFEPVRSAWTLNAHGLGRRGTVTGAGLDLAGEIAGIDSAGGLRLIDGARIVIARAGSLRFD